MFTILTFTAILLQPCAASQHIKMLGINCSFGYFKLPIEGLFFCSASQTKKKEKTMLIISLVHQMLEERVRGLNADREGQDLLELRLTTYFLDFTCLFTEHGRLLEEKEQDNSPTPNPDRLTSLFDPSGPANPGCGLQAQGSRGPAA